MLGLADRGRVLDLFEMVMRGDAAAALEELSAQYAEGADPLAVLRDLAEITHWISVVKITPDAAEDPTISPSERARGMDLAGRLPMRALTRTWQMLLKALDEVAAAPNAMMAAEMAVIRLTHVAELPSPEELVRRLKDQPVPPGPPGGGAAGTTPGGATTARGGPAPGGRVHGPVAQLAQEPEEALARYPTFDHVVELIRTNRDVKLLVEVETCVRLVSYRPGRIEFTPTEEAPRDLAQKLGSRLQGWTGNRWAVIVTTDGTAETIAEKRDAKELALKQEASAHPMVQAVMAAFPKAKITAIRTAEEVAAAAATEALAEVEDEWDPFEEE
jgi:DNA polymerase-3 subunit gamma/tau